MPHLAATAEDEYFEPPVSVARHARRACDKDARRTPMWEPPRPDAAPDSLLQTPKFAVGYKQLEASARIALHICRRYGGAPERWRAVREPVRPAIAPTRLPDVLERT